LLASRVSLGTSRLLFALLIMLAISVGLLLGLVALGQSLTIVSMIPGSNLIRMASGLVQLGNGPDIASSVLGDTIFEGVTAITVILAISAGLIVPKQVFDRCLPRARRKSE